MSPALEIVDVRLALGGRAVLDGVTLGAARGEVTALVGPNGAGKTTLIRCCTHILAPDSGTIAVLGRPVAEAVAGGRIAVMPQTSGAWLGIRPLELLEHLAGLHATPLPIAPLARRLGLDEFARTPYRRLSGGQQQAVNLAAALIGRPELVVLDEPTAGMDPHARRSVWELIAELRRAGVSVLLTTHQMDEAERLADRIHIMDGGRIRLSGTLGELTGGERSLLSVFLANTETRMRP